MARFLDDSDFVEGCDSSNRKVDLKIWIDWFGDGQLDEVGSADDEFLKLDLSREVEGDSGKAILDQGTLILDNSNNQYSPKSIASRFNVDMGDYYEFNVIPNRGIMIDISVNGSEFKHYYGGIISSIDNSYDNSKVSITISDEMGILQNFQAPDKFYIKEDAKNVIEDLLMDTPIDYDSEKVDDLNFSITYNFKEEGTIFDALKLIAGVVYGKFFVLENTLNFINYKQLDQVNKESIKTLNDSEILNENYQETFSSEDLYPRVEVISKPYNINSDSSGLEVIWTGTESNSNINEEYNADDISDKSLQLTSTKENGTEIDTRNVPIVEGSLTVSFDNKTYSLGYGIDNINYEEGIITFEDSSEYPQPNGSFTVEYSYSLLSIAPGKSKEIIAEYEYPSIDIQDIKETLYYQGVAPESEIEYNSETHTFNNVSYHRDISDSGTITRYSDEYELPEGTQTIEADMKLSQYAYDYKWAWDAGSKAVDRECEVHLIGDDEVIGLLGTATKHRDNHITSDPISIPEGVEKIKLRFSFTRNVEKKSGFTAFSPTITIGTKSKNVEDEPDVSVSVKQYDFSNNKKTRLTFTNNSDSTAILYSKYKGKKYDNLLLVGRPLKQVDEYEVVEYNQDADESFGFSTNTLTINNNLFTSERRITELANFLIDDLAYPKIKLNVDIKGRGYLDLLDKITFEREESDIDNEFLIYGIEENFNDNGEWNQTLELVQARTSEWVFDSEGIVSIDKSKSGISEPTVDRPSQIEDLSLSLKTIEGGNSGYPIIKVTYTGNKETSYYNIYLRRGISGSWEYIDRTQDEEIIIDSVYGRAEYFVKVVGENNNNILSEFASAPVESIQYFGADLILSDDIDLREVLREVQKGTSVSFIEIRIDSDLGDYVEELEIYYKHEDDTEWTLDGKTDRLFYEILASRLGYYEVKVIAKDIRGNKPDFNDVESVVIKVEGKTDKPTATVFETIYWGEDYIEIEWEPHPDDDFKNYEVRLDNNFGIEEDF